MGAKTIVNLSTLMCATAALALLKLIIYISIMCFIQNYNNKGYWQAALYLKLSQLKLSPHK